MEVVFSCKYSPVKKDFPGIVYISCTFDISISRSCLSCSDAVDNDDQYTYQDYCHHYDYDDYQC